MIPDWIPIGFQSIKLDIIAATGLAKDALHVYIGLALFLAIRLCWRRRGGWVLAWLAVLVLAVGTEWLDIQMEALDNGNQPDSAHWHDIWNTMFWPTVLLLIGPWLQQRPKPKDEPSGDLADESLEETPPVNTTMH